MPGLTAEVRAPVHDAWFLVTGTCGGAESTFGIDSEGRARPQPARRLMVSIEGEGAPDTITQSMRFILAFPTQDVSLHDVRMLSPAFDVESTLAVDITSSGDVIVESVRGPIDGAPSDPPFVTHELTFALIGQIPDASAFRITDCSGAATPQPSLAG